MNFSKECDRREFLRTTTLVGAAVASALATSTGACAANRTNFEKPHHLIDTNVALSRWPFRRLPLDETAALVAKLSSLGVRQAWAGSFDALLHKNLAWVNARLSEECRQQGRGILISFGSINPKLPGWEEDFHRCCDVHKMPGLRLHPNYHNYKLDDSQFAKLLSLAASKGLIVQIAASMEDERMQHPLMRVPNVDLSPLPGLLEKNPTLKIVLLNWPRSAKPELAARLAQSRKVWFDIAMVEGVGGVSQLFDQIPQNRILFGSHSPFYYFESALLKLQESPLNSNQVDLISFKNAQAL